MFQEVITVITILITLIAVCLLILLFILARDGGRIASSFVAAGAGKLRAIARLPILTFLALTLLNLSMVAVIFRGSFIIYSDGPGGFGEVAIKQLLLLASLLIFAAATLLYRAALRSAGIQKTRFFLLGLTATSILIGVCWIFVYEACANDKGHCRNWKLAAYSSKMY
jgi:hypothetical protein